jgi:hypothetical protein
VRPAQSGSRAPIAPRGATPAAPCRGPPPRRALHPHPRGTCRPSPLPHAPQGGGGDSGDDARAKERKEREVQEYVDALTRGGVKKEMAQDVLKEWESAGQDPKALRKLFLKQSAVPAVATTVQVGLFFRGRRAAGKDLKRRVLGSAAAREARPLLTRARPPQTLVDAAAAYSIFTSAIFFA